MVLIRKIKKIITWFFERIESKLQLFPLLLCSLVISFYGGNIFGLFTKRIEYQLSFVIAVPLFLEYINYFYYSLFNPRIKSIKAIEAIKKIDISRRSAVKENNRFKLKKTRKIDFVLFFMQAIKRGFLLGLFVDAFRVGS